MTMSTPSMSTSTEASAKILPNFTGLIERSVIETVLEEDGPCHRAAFLPLTNPGEEKQPG
jgi:hypothetical protein